MLALIGSNSDTEWPGKVLRILPIFLKGRKHFACDKSSKYILSSTFPVRMKASGKFNPVFLIHLHWNSSVFSFYTLFPWSQLSELSSELSYFRNKASYLNSWKGSPPPIITPPCSPPPIIQGILKYSSKCMSEG